LGRLKVMMATPSSTVNKRFVNSIWSTPPFL
jgi:hypothetical protein